MNNQCDRRGFVKVGAAAGAAWVMGSECLAEGASDGKVEPIEDVRVGMVGIGNRGTFLLKLLLEQEGVMVKAVCDLIPQRVAKAQDMVTAAKQPKPTGYSRGETDFKRLCETEELDLVVNATRPWKWHVPISVAAMTTGKHAATEVPAADTVEGCWELVETTEKTQKYCVMLENCCYFREVMLVHNSPTKQLTVTVARIRDVAFVGVGCELLTEVGMAIKAGSPYRHTFVMTHCNGRAGYLPPKHLYDEGGYEIDRTGFAPQAADILVKESLRMLSNLK